jgi:hypothetical protein
MVSSLVSAFMISPKLLLTNAVFLLVSNAGAVDFNTDIRPILANKCFACHGPDEHERKAKLRLDTEEGALADLGGYRALEPGDAAKSELIARITTDDEDDVMPPRKSGKEVSKEEAELLSQWIAEGGKYDEHWAYQPLSRPEPPAVPAGMEALSPIDHFVAARLAENGLPQSEEADRVTLIRRLSLDLTGLPPSPDEVAAFVKDKSKDAYARVVDRMLDDKHFGERMALYWLDLVRYADTIGYHSDTTQPVAAYRDYVINAFNQNLPYDQFTREQLAGDLLPNATIEQKIASGYNRLLQTTEEGGAQEKEYRAQCFIGLARFHAGLCAVPRSQIRSVHRERLLQHGGVLCRHQGRRGRQTPAQPADSHASPGCPAGGTDRSDRRTFDRKRSAKQCRARSEGDRRTSHLGGRRQSDSCGR